MVGVLDDGLLQHPLEPPLGEAAAQGREARGVAEGIRRVAPVEPLVVGVVEEGEPAREAAVVLLAVVELGPVQKRLQPRAVKPLRDEGGQRLALHVLHDERSLQLGGGADAEADILAEPTVEQGLLERRVVVARERVGDHVERHQLLAFVEAPEDPGVAEDDLPVRRLVRADLVLDRLRGGNGRLVGDGGVDLGARVGGEEAVELREDGGEVHPAVQEDARVGRVVERAVERRVRLEGELGDGGGVAARDEAVARLRIEEAAQLVVEAALRVREGALHLAVDDAVAAQLAVRRVQLVVPALLLEREGVLHAQRVEDGVHVHVDEVEEIGAVARADGVHRRVRARPGVQERREGALQQIDERLLHGILLRAAEDGMFDDVGDARVILREGAEPDREGHVVVVAVEPRKVRAVLLVRHPHEPPLHLGQFRHAPHGEPAHDVAGPQRGGRRRQRHPRQNGHRQNLSVHFASPVSFSRRTISVISAGTPRRSGKPAHCPVPLLT